MRKISWLAVLASVCVALAGCSGSDSPPPTPPSPPKSASNQSGAQPVQEKKVPKSNPEAEWQAKAQAYIRVNNSMMGFLSSRSTSTRAEENVKKGDFKSIRTDEHYFDASSMRNLEKAMNLPGDFPEIDASAKRLIATAEKYVPVWKELREYNKAKKFEDDNGAHGKKLLSVYSEGIDLLKEQLRDLSTKIDVIAKESHEKTLAKHKAEGRLLEVHTLEALGAAEKIVETFSDAADFKNQNKINAANAQLAIMETNLEGLKTEHAKRKEADQATDRKNRSLPMIDRYNSVHSKLVSLAGYYREARKNPNSFNSVISSFNGAISDYNMMQR